MKLTELRIGNLFQWIEIASMGIGVDVITKENHYAYEDFKEPIPLTEEWLKRLGFEPNSGIHFRTLSTGYIACGLDGSWGLYNNLSAWNRGNSYNNGHDIEFVHQLQNLYHALTGKELTITKTN